MCPFPFLCTLRFSQANLTILSLVICCSATSLKICIMQAKFNKKYHLILSII
uniref:Uncharacterized protein n=1 Tax=Arundo donax TaxID=35708 RepID=A0A0A9GGC1_ARUDO